MPRILATLCLVFLFSGHGRAESFWPWAATRYADPTGQFAAIVLRTEGTRHFAEYGEVELTIVKRHPSQPLFSRGSRRSCWTAMSASSTPPAGHSNASKTRNDR